MRNIETKVSECEIFENIQSVNLINWPKKYHSNITKYEHSQDGENGVGRAHFKIGAGRAYALKYGKKKIIVPIPGDSVGYGHWTRHTYNRRWGRMGLALSKSEDDSSGFT